MTFITPTTKQAAAIRTKSAATRNIRVAMIVTPMGRFMLPPLNHEQRGRREQEAGCFWLGREQRGWAGGVCSIWHSVGRAGLRENRTDVLLTVSGRGANAGASFGE